MSSGEHSRYLQIQLHVPLAWLPLHARRGIREHSMNTNTAKHYRLSTQLPLIARFIADGFGEPVVSGEKMLIRQ